LDQSLKSEDDHMLAYSAMLTSSYSVETENNYHSGKLELELSLAILKFGKYYIKISECLGKVSKSTIFIFVAVTFC
jgi:hypothetical protein